MHVRPTTAADAAGGARDPTIAPSVRLERRVDGQLWLTGDAGDIAVTVQRCFPWSQPARFLSLRDEANDEVAMVHDLEDLDAASREALEDALAVAGFVFRVVRIIDVGDEIEIRRWKVETEQGPRSFQTGRDTWPREVPGNGFLLRDVAGDLYLIDNAATLDKTSSALLWAFVE